MKKRKSETVFKCDYCGSITSYFVATAEYKYFCLEQVPGYPASKDCMTDYLQDLKNKTPTIPLPNTIYKSDFYS